MPQPFALAEIGFSNAKAEKEVEADRNVVLVVGDIECDDFLLFPFRVFHE